MPIKHYYLFIKHNEVMSYIIDQCYDFPVAEPDSPQDDYFKLTVSTATGPSVVRLKKLPFQRNSERPLPSSLYCRVKSFDDNGLPVLTHIVGPYVFELYQQQYVDGESFECEVIFVPNTPAEEPFTVRDKYGIFYRLNEPDGLLTKGQRIRCKFTKLTPRFFTMTRVDEGAKMPFFSPDFLFDAVQLPGVLRGIIKRNVISLPEMEVVKSEIAAKQPRWVLTASRAILKHLSEWFLKARLTTHGALYRSLLNYMREMVLFLLEGSSFLNALPSEDRRSLQQQLTEIVESLQPFDRVVELVVSDGQYEFVERLFDKLQKSGYLYHPAKQFAILMLIFRMQPDKVGYYLSRIFESIFSRDLDNWKREPFRSAFVEQFQIYVRLARREIDALPLAESREQKSRLETIITAIALQLLLSSSDADVSRTYSLFYRYVSLLRPLNTEALLSKSFLSLMKAGLSFRLNYEQLREPMMMMTQATIVPAGDILDRIPSTHLFSNGLVDISISSAGIVLQRCSQRNVTERVIPEGLMPWLKPQIKLNGVAGLSGGKLRKLSEHNSWWHSIETSLFETQAAPAKQPDAERPKKRAERGDEVFIVIDGVDDFFTPNPTFVCHIEDTEYLDGTGILKRDMIVGYNLKQPSERAYKSDDGSQYGFLARVLDVRPDGSFIFSLRDEVDRYMENSLDFETEYLAVVTGINERDYSAIARDGFGLFLEKEHDRRFDIGDIVRFKIHQKGTQGNIRAYITEKTDMPEDRFDKSVAFVNLMDSLCYRTGEDDNADEEDSSMMRDIDEMLSPDDIREVVEIIRFKAVAESDLIKAYDYLRFSRLLALAIGDQKLAEKLGTHASLLTLHQYFATNSRIDAEKLEKLHESVLADPLLSMIYHRLELVSWLDRPEHNSDLYATAMEPGSELEGSIAKMVLSYNMIHASDTSDSGIASSIKTKIMDKLNVNNETRPGKYYGSESKYLEFKTSIVYPATAPGEEMREDPAAQQFHILSRIAGMLNANGGRLYIGVNNDGYEVGMRDDFKYFERHRMSAGQYNFRISNVDSLCVFLENLIDHTFGSTLARKISIGADDEAEKEVVLINIEESLEPVFLDNRLFVRQSGQSTKEYHGKDIDDFVRERGELMAERAHLLSLARANEPRPEAAPASAAADTQAAPASKDKSKPAQASVSTIATSAWRPNVLHSYENGYAEPCGYLYFTGENKLLFSSNDLYKETGDGDCRLALAIPHELSDGFLVLAFEGERALKIPLAEIYEKGENIAVEYFGGARLMFASAATKDDALICVLADGSASLWRRGVMLNQIESGHLTSTPKRIHDTVTDHTVAWEIADSSAVSQISDCLADNLAARRIGVTLRVKEDTANAPYKLKELTDKCRPTSM